MIGEEKNKNEEEKEMGMTMLESEEYKNLVLKEKELDEAKKIILKNEEEKLQLQEEIKQLQENLKELLLKITDNKTSFYSNEIQRYEIDEDGLTKYLNKYYIEDTRLEFKKKQLEENKEAE